MPSKYAVSKTTLMLGTFISASFAHSQAASLKDDNASTQATQTEVISVTASKSAVSIHASPDSVSAILASEIERISPQHINQALARIPGTWISRGNGQEHLTAIRSPVLTGAGSCGAFFMGLDGISIRAPGFCNANQLFDINYEQAARVDVLRSPASTLYGGNALHGVINIISQDAFNIDNSLALSAGANGFMRLSNAVGSHTSTDSNNSSNSAWLNLLNVTNENGYQSESGYDQQKMTHIYQVKGSKWSNKSVLDVSNLNQETAGFIRGFESYKDEAIRRTNPNPEAYRDTKSLRAYSLFSTVNDYGEWQITPYLRANEMAFLQHFLPWQALEENKHQSLGVQSKVNYSLNGINLISGIDLDYTHGSLRETQDDDFSPSIPAGVHYDYKVKATQIAAYTQASWEVDDWSFRVGARIENNRYDYNNKVEGNSACAPEVEVCRFSRPDDQDLSFSALSPSASAQYQFSANSLWYVKYSQGFRAPQATELFRLQNNQLVSDIDNENMDAVESGLRWRNDSTRLHIAAYYMQKEDVIFQNTQRQNVTGGETSHKGVELEFGHALTDSLSVNGHLSYAKHLYENNVALVNAEIKGNVIDTAPQWISQLNLVYRASEKLNAQLSWQYLDEYYLDPQNTAEYEGHSLIDLHINYALSERAQLRLHMLNLSDTDYAERADFAFGAYRYFVGQPRRFFVDIVWNY